MKKRCKNCAHRIHAKRDDVWCGLTLKYINDDSCCTKYQTRFSLEATSIVALVIALIGLVVAVLGLTNVI